MHFYYSINLSTCLKKKTNLSTKFENTPQSINQTLEWKIKLCTLIILKNINLFN